MKSPIVGTSQSAPMHDEHDCSGARATARRIFAATRVARGRGRYDVAVQRRRPSDVPLEAADVEREHRDDEQEEEDGDRRADAEVVSPP